jgi:hypothetical protein
MAETISHFSLLQLVPKKFDKVFRLIVETTSKMNDFSIKIDSQIREFFTTRQVISFWKPSFTIKESILEREKIEDVDDEDIFEKFLKRKIDFLARIGNRQGNYDNRQKNFKAKGRGRSRAF